MENSVFHSHSSLCYSKISNPLSGGLRVHFIVGSNGLRYIVVQGTKWYIVLCQGSGFRGCGCTLRTEADVRRMSPLLVCTHV